ncbi:unnamed protein product [marine sediment metagenome]|uniref:Uncharacterized protein n=1 Tax=marine sediment metagenome TaxID=412755 RepID=X1IA21_9ZZZZ
MKEETLSDKIYAIEEDGYLKRIVINSLDVKEFINKVLQIVVNTNDSIITKIDKIKEESGEKLI